MKRIAILTAILACSILVQAQTGAFHPFSINPGLGSGGIDYDYYAGLSENRNSASPTLSLEWMFRPVVGIGRISLGLTGSLTTSKYTYYPANPGGPEGGGLEDAEYEHHTNALFGLRAAYHFILKPKGLDPYAGIMGDYTTYNEPSYAKDLFPIPSHYHAGYFVGIRYFFLPRLGAFAEVGKTGYSIATLGISFRM